MGVANQTSSGGPPAKCQIALSRTVSCFLELARPPAAGARKPRARAACAAAPSCADLPMQGSPTTTAAQPRSGADRDERG
jgi:hypothetical protein